MMKRSAIALLLGLLLAAAPLASYADDDDGTALGAFLGGTIGAILGSQAYAPPQRVVIVHRPYYPPRREVIIIRHPRYAEDYYEDGPEHYRWSERRWHDRWDRDRGDDDD